MSKQNNLNLVPALFAVSITLIIWFVIPPPETVDPNAWHLLALFAGTIAAIIGKAMPIGALSIIAIGLVAVTGVTNPTDAGKAMTDALSGFSNSLIWLIGISIFISRGLIKTGLGARIAYYFISILGKNTLGIAYGLTLSELMIAPVTPSNTARGGGIIHPVMKSIASSFDSKPEDESRTKLGRYLALVNYNTNPITSSMFITATAPNPLIVSIVATATGAAAITWSMWALAAFVPGIVALLLMPLIIYKLSPPEIKNMPHASDFAKENLAKMGSMSRAEKIMIAVFMFLLLLWADVPAMIFGDAFKVNYTATAFLGLSLLLLTNVLSWDDVLSEKSAWDTVLWFSALVMMASFLGKLGLVSWFSSAIQGQIESAGLGWMSGAVLLVLIYFYSHYFFASTTAHITAMLAAFLTAGIALGCPPMLLALLMAMASSFMMSLTHYATGTAPIIFGSGYCTLGEWWKVGFVMSLVNLTILFVIGSMWWKVLGLW